MVDRHWSNRPGCDSTCPVRSVGFSTPPNSGSAALSAATVSGVKVASGTPWLSRWSTVIARVPPGMLNTDTPPAGPRCGGKGAVTSNSAAASRSVRLDTSTAPERANRS